MRVPRCFLSDLPSGPGQAVALDADESAHVSRVLRLKPGAEVEAFDGRGGVARMAVVNVGRREVEVELLERLEVSRELPFALTCAVATPKGKRARRMVEALSELGVTTYAPLVLQRSNARSPDVEQARRWCLEACKQCKRNVLPEVLPPQDLSGLLALADRAEIALLPDTADAEPLGPWLSRPRPASALVAVGPEGGFAPAERVALRDAGLKAVTLGPSVLRIETAAQAVVGALAAAWS